MQIGKPLRRIVVEPLELPVTDCPQRQPPAEGAALPSAEAERVPDKP